MTSRLRELGVRVALVCAFVATATHVTAPKPDLPFALLESFDRAFALVYDAAERSVAKLEATEPPSAPRPRVSAILDQLERQIAGLSETAATALEVELALTDALPVPRRIAVLACITRHIDEARRAATAATDPDERAEYLTTCDRLGELRGMI